MAESERITRRSLLGGVVCMGGALSLPAPLFGAVTPLPTRPGNGAFPLVQNAMPAGILVDRSADTAVQHAANGFAADLERVSGRPPRRYASGGEASGPLVVIGVQGQSAIIDGLISSGKIDVGDIRGEWEAFRQIVVDRPFAGVPRALIIVGSDRRGAVFGTYDLSERMGVSPWHWFADVPVQRRSDVFVPAGSRRGGRSLSLARPR